MIKLTKAILLATLSVFVFSAASWDTGVSETQWEGGTVLICAYLPVQPYWEPYMEQVCVSEAETPEVCFDVNYLPTVPCPRPEWAGPFQQGPMSVQISLPISIHQQRRLQTGETLQLHMRGRRTINQPIDAPIHGDMDLFFENAPGILSITLQRRIQ